MHAITVNSRLQLYIILCCLCTGTVVKAKSAELRIHVHVLRNEHYVFSDQIIYGVGRAVATLLASWG